MDSLFKFTDEGIKYLAKLISDQLKDGIMVEKQSEQEIPVDINEASVFVKKSKYTLYGKVSRNEIPFHKRGKHLYFFKSELITWLKTGKQEDKTSVQNEVDEYLLKNQM
ncbi:DNA binding domain-containing protein, excisionase family [Maribacter aquivivus]|uniref:DNA binding domain-containing protein, excisionase family n=1 Tax=Maribacter aquivivus TaxID=228958 RepID=A0A1M6TUH7_9FLAO|nr:helix-turn-helix domain-containing protein [Maribacter aquivivus]SHK60695.1 DNA binding domain-containing protein, excisionase family [Maribacter aquivivus]